MQIKTLFLGALAAVSALAFPSTLYERDNTTLTTTKPIRVKGYPRGRGNCINDAQAKFIVDKFKSILTTVNRTAAANIAQGLLLDTYVETSDSINVLAGYPQGGPSFDGKAAFIAGVLAARPVDQMDDLDIMHDCNKIVWQWVIPTLGMRVSPIKGFNKITIDNNYGWLKANDLEFNSIAWNSDVGGQWTPAGGSCTQPGAPPSRRL